MLLPQPEEEDPREELVRQLMEYKTAKEAAKTLSERESEFAGRFEKDTVELKPVIGEDTRIDLELLTKALAGVFARAAEEIKRKEMMKIPNIPIVKRKRRTVEGSAISILKKMVKRKAVHFDELFEGAEDRTDIISIFYALLELLRVGRVSIERPDDYDKTDSNVILRLNTDHTREKEANS
jgi:segregation and condensation protein A